MQAEGVVRMEHQEGALLGRSSGESTPTGAFTTSSGPVPTASPLAPCASIAVTAATAVTVASITSTFATIALSATSALSAAAGA
jgi:hypothetical protein